MKTPEWCASYVRGIPAMTAEQKMVYLEIAECIEQLAADACNWEIEATLLKGKLTRAEQERDAVIRELGNFSDYEPTLKFFRD